MCNIFRKYNISKEMAGKFSYAEAVKGSINTYYDLVIDIKDSHNQTYGWNLGKPSKIV